MNWFKKYYGKDPRVKFAIGFLLVFLALGVYLEPAYWYCPVLAFIGYYALFYFMRKNP